MSKEILYRGWDERKQCWEEFVSNDPADATPEASGYDKVEEIGEVKN